MSTDACVCCLLELDDEQRVYYQHSLSSEWMQAKYCWETINHMLSAKYKDYMERIYQSKCRHELNGMLTSGPPRWYKDEALPVPEGAHVTRFRRMVNGVIDEVPALYAGAPEHEEDRERIWADVEAKIQERIRFIAIAEGRDPNSDDIPEPNGEDD